VDNPGNAQAAISVHTAIAQPVTPATARAHKPMATLLEPLVPPIANNSLSTGNPSASAGFGNLSAPTAAAQQNSAGFGNLSAPPAAAQQNSSVHPGSSFAVRVVTNGHNVPVGGAVARVPARPTFRTGLKTVKPVSIAPLARAPTLAADGAAMVAPGGTGTCATRAFPPGGSLAPLLFPDGSVFSNISGRQPPPTDAVKKEPPASAIARTEPSGNRISSANTHSLAPAGAPLASLAGGTSPGLPIVPPLPPLPAPLPPMPRLPVWSAATQRYGTHRHLPATIVNANATVLATAPATIVNANATVLATAAAAEAQSDSVFVKPESINYAQARSNAQPPGMANTIKANQPPIVVSDGHHQSENVHRSAALAASNASSSPSAALAAPGPNVSSVPVHEPGTNASSVSVHESAANASSLCASAGQVVAMELSEAEAEASAPRVGTHARKEPATGVTTVPKIAPGPGPEWAAGVQVRNNVDSVADDTWVGDCFIESDVAGSAQIEAADTEWANESLPGVFLEATSATTIAAAAAARPSSGARARAVDTRQSQPGGTRQSAINPLASSGHIVARKHPPTRIKSDDHDVRGMRPGGSATSRVAGRAGAASVSTASADGTRSESFPGPARQSGRRIAPPPPIQTALARRHSPGGDTLVDCGPPLRRAVSQRPATATTGQSTAMIRPPAFVSFDRSYAQTPATVDPAAAGSANGLASSHDLLAYLKRDSASTLWPGFE
jgi:hypothetical protein